jgi:PAS domain S-box-containing protein
MDAAVTSTPRPTRSRHSTSAPSTSTLTASEALRLAEEKFATTFHLSPDMILISTQADGRCLDVNDAYLRHTGYLREEIIGHKTCELDLWATADDRRNLLEQLARDGAVHGLEKEYRKKSGEVGCAVFYAERISIDGEPCLILMAQDVTAYKRAQATLSRYAADLQSRNEELDAFAHTVAHDLKNPLSNIMGFSEYLQARPALPDEIRTDYLNAIARNAFKMDSIIDELLLLAKVRMGDVSPQPLDMGRIVSEALHRLTFMISEARALIRVPDHWPVVEGYGPWVEEVWVNYLSNAIKYGGQPPHIELGGAAQPDGSVRFWVKDNGPGLPAELQAQLFQPFSQLSTIRATGHGLGLSIVRQIVEKMGGQVQARSLKYGSEFSFTLPAGE